MFSSFLNLDCKLLARFSHQGFLITFLLVSLSASKLLASCQIISSLLDFEADDMVGIAVKVLGHLTGLCPFHNLSTFFVLLKTGFHLTFLYNKNICVLVLRHEIFITDFLTSWSN